MILRGCCGWARTRRIHPRPEHVPTKLAANRADRGSEPVRIVSRRASPSQHQAQAEAQYSEKQHRPSVAREAAETPAAFTSGIAIGLEEASDRLRNGAVWLGNRTDISIGIGRGNRHVVGHVVL